MGLGNKFRKLMEAIESMYLTVKLWIAKFLSVGALQRMAYIKVGFTHVGSVD